MTDYNPVQIEEAIRECATRIAKGVTVCGNAYKAFLEAEGPQHAKKYAAELATLDERRARDVADSAYRFADRKARALETELRAWQSVGASVRVMYGAAGRGEGA